MFCANDSSVLTVQNGSQNFDASGIPAVASASFTTKLNEVSRIGEAQSNSYAENWKLAVNPEKQIDTQLLRNTDFFADVVGVAK